MATTLNSTPRVARKSLADQIDRLDTILDGLSDALNESVADAVRGVVGTAVRQAVQRSLQEVFDQPEVLRLAMLKHGMDTFPLGSPSPVSWRQRLAGLLQRTRQTLHQAVCSFSQKLHHLRTWTGEQLRRMSEASLALFQRTSQGTGTLVSTASCVVQATGRRINSFARLLWSHPVVTVLTLGTGAVGVTLGVFGPREVTATLLGVSSSLVALGGSLMARLRGVTRHLPLSV